jgi:hypothetical protein
MAIFQVGALILIPGVQAFRAKAHIHLFAACACARAFKTTLSIDEQTIQGLHLYIQRLIIFVIL